MTIVISMIDRQTASGLPRPGMSALRIITGMTADEFAAPGAPPLPSTQPVGRAGGATPTLQGRHGAVPQAAGGPSHGAGGDAARRACSPALGDVASRAPPVMPANAPYE
jgi:hypothetical protein